MAYISQEDKKAMAPAIKAVLNKYGMKGSISIDNNSTLVVRVKSGVLDIFGNYNRVAESKPHDRNNRVVSDYMDVNCYWIESNYDGEVQQFLEELTAALKGERFFDDSDSQTDYFHCSHYVQIAIGRWDKPYILEA